MYFLIHVTEDGDVYVKQYKKDDLLKVIKDGYFGDMSFLEHIEEENPQYWGANTLIIRGEIVTPKPVEVVTDYEL